MYKTKSYDKDTLGSLWKCGSPLIWVTICTYLIIAYVKYSLKSTLSIYEIMQILGISVFDKTPVKELITELEVNQNLSHPVPNRI